MKRVVKCSTQSKRLSLDMFDVRDYMQRNYRGEKRPMTDYILNIDGYRISIYQGFSDKVPYSISFTYPSGYKGEVGGFKTPEDAVNYLNDKEWWNFKEPSADQVRRAIEDEWNPPRENYGYRGR